jgi:hypothetical protein
MTPAEMAASGIQSTINDGEMDIAETFGREQMRVQANGRKTFQTCNLWMPLEEKKAHTTKGATIRMYDVENCGPEHGGTEVLPDPAELEPAEETKLYMEVGFIIGDDPGRHTATGTPNAIARKTEQRNRGIMDRERNSMRVFVPVEDTILKQ